MPPAEGSAPPPNLGLLFATNAPDVEARNVFVNRVSEQEAFDEAVSGHRASIMRPEFDSQDVVTLRRNVLVYYGVGGSGKTSLSRELERRHSSDGASTAADWPAWHTDFKRSVTARIDLASEAGLDLERVLMCLRVAVAAIGRPMHAFDIALSRYWEHVHPNESIAEYLQSDSGLGRLSKAMNVPEQITNGLMDVASALGAPTTIVTVAATAATAITTAVRQKRAKRHAVQGCWRLASLLESEPDLESLSYYPHLLSWDLAQAAQQAKRSFHVAVFLDTFEDVARGEERRFERLMNRMVWLMPNVLFVFSTRNRLDWGDMSAEGQLDFAGPVSWPGLVLGAAGEPSQHLVGYLSPADTDKFLRERLRRGGEPIPEAVRLKIAQESEGYPLYLDLAVTHYLQLAETGTEPQPDHFTGGFPQLVVRVLRDMPADERRLIRILSLLDSFDVRLAVAIARLPSEAAAVRLSGRSFVDTYEAAPFPFAIHRLLREQIRESDSGPDAFTGADWRRYASRSFEELGVRFAEARESGDRPMVISLLNQALRLGDEFDLPVGWTADAAYAFIEDSLWEDSLRPLVRLPPVTAAAALAQTLIAITIRQSEGRRRTAEVLIGLLDSGLLAGDVRDLAVYYAAESSREIGEGERSEELLRSLVSSDSRIADLAVKGMVHRRRRAGRFTEALDLIQSRPESGMWIQMTGTLYWSQGMLDEAKSAYVAARDRFLADGRPGHAAEVSGCLAFVCGLSAIRGDDADLVASGATVLQQSRNTWARLMARLGETLLTATGGAETIRQLGVIEADGRKAGLTSIEAYARFFGCLNAALSGDDTRLRVARVHLTALGSDDFRWLVEVVDFLLGADPSGTASDWLGGADAARWRWRQIIADRRDGRVGPGVTPQT